MMKVSATGALPALPIDDFLRTLGARHHFLSEALFIYCGNALSLPRLAVAALIRGNSSAAKRIARTGFRYEK